jgi:magnesium chelatase subunit D
MDSVHMPASMGRLAALICVNAGALGHRADIGINRTARALAALRAALDRSAVLPRVTREDVVRAAELVLPHRRTEPAGDQASGTEGIPDSMQQRMQEFQPPRPSEESAATSASDRAQGAAGGSDGGERTAAGGDAGEGLDHGSSDPQRSFAGELFGVRRIQLPRDRRQRRSPGKRSITRSGDRRGRYVRSARVERTTDVAFDATLRAAAPYQPNRRAEAGDADGPSLKLERQDLRQKVRQRRTGSLIVFVVDASASMDAEQRMQATKGAILSLLRDAYVRRDKVALVVFSGRTARVVLRPTSSVDLAEQRLQKLTVGGTTPLTQGLVAGLALVRTERLRDATVYPLLVLISDGRGNISLFGDEPLIEAQTIAARIRTDNIRSLVIDSARDFTHHAALPAIRGAGGLHPTLTGAQAFNPCLDLAERLGGTYHGLYDLSQGAILQTVERSLRGL